MKPQLLKVPAQPENSFSIRFDSVPYFYNYWHYHPEVELIYIRKGRGTQFMGDHISSFREGDVLLVGPNLPHLWRCDEIYHQGHENIRAEAVVVHFLPDFWGKSFMELPEMFAIRQLLKQASRGIRITGQTGQEVIGQMEALHEVQMAERIWRLIRVLQLIAHSPETDRNVLSLSTYYPTFDQRDNHRLNLIYTFILTNYFREIKLQELADLVSMNRLAFCRYFKSRTSKTFVQFLMEVRIGQACKLLINNKLSIHQVALECGYNNYSNFTRQFRSIVKLTPKDYRKKYLDR